jgi:hypothetical protein
MIGIFIFGCFITAIVATACGLIVAGIRADKRELEELSEQQIEQHPSSGRSGA